MLQYVATQSNKTCPICTSINILSHKFMMYPCICTSQFLDTTPLLPLYQVKVKQFYVWHMFVCCSFLWQQQTTQLPKLNSHNEACLSICQSLQPELSRGWWTTSTPCLFQHCSLNTDWIAGLVTSVTKSSKIWLEKLSYCILYLFLLILWLIIKFWCWLYWLRCRVEWFWR